MFPIVPTATAPEGEILVFLELFDSDSVFGVVDEDEVAGELEEVTTEVDVWVGLVTVCVCGCALF